MRRALISGIFLLTLLPACAQSGTVAFYNVENLFDTTNDPAAADGDFTPEGAYRWDAAKYDHKVGRIAQVINALEADLIGLAEVENERVLDDLTAAARERGGDALRFVHRESSDGRGIDAALLYRPGVFVPDAVRLLPLDRLGGPFREMLHVAGRWQGRPTHILVCHLPSMTSSAEVRRRAAASVGAAADSLAAADPDHLLIVMGDLNANPASPAMKPLSDSALRNPFEALYRRGVGSYRYRDRWNLYDQILVGGPLRRAPRARVFVRPELIQPDGPYRGYPYRSFSGTEYIGGYSDHLPVMLIFR